MLLVPELLKVRVVVRMAAFGASLAFLAIIPARRAQTLPARSAALWILVILGLEFFHPEGSGLLAAFASIMLHLAVLAPIFWIPRTAVNALTFQRLVTILWLFYAASAALGVLQAYFPGRFDPPLSAVIAEHGPNTADSLKIQLASGERAFRPMGLTGTPGGAAQGGLYAILLGTGVILLPKPPFWGARLLAVVSTVAGMMCLYLCQIRSLVVMAGVCVVTLLALLLVSGRVSRLLGLVASLGTVIPGAFILAVSLGGRAMTDRLTTLTEADPGAVYFKHRGHFLEQTITEFLPQYPLGAGLGRWGMVHSYFGTDSGSLWAEIQWTAWLFDGGLPLVLAYFVAILLVSSACLKVALGGVGGGDGSLSLWGAVLVAYNVGTVALCFTYPIFEATGGVEFWLLNAALLCAAQNSEPGLLRRTAAA